MKNKVRLVLTNKPYYFFALTIIKTTLAGKKYWANILSKRTLCYERATHPKAENRTLKGRVTVWSIKYPKSQCCSFGHNENLNFLCFFHRRAILTGITNYRRVYAFYSFHEAFEDSIAVLTTNTSGVLAVAGEEGYPYAVPLSYVCHKNKIYFHCAKSGHKLDAIEKNNKVSFYVIDQDQVVLEEYTTYLRSIIACGHLTVTSLSLF